MMRVKCTREGLVGGTTASGYIIQPLSWFCALPSVKALRRVVRICAEVGPPGKMGTLTLTVPVADVGPWEEHDDAYVFGNARPMAESGIDTRGRTTNGSGIDLSNLVFETLGNPTFVYWDFC